MIQGTELINELNTGRRQLLVGGLAIVILPATAHASSGRLAVANVPSALAEAAGIDLLPLEIQGFHKFQEAAPHMQINQLRLIDVGKNYLGEMCRGFSSTAKDFAGPCRYQLLGVSDVHAGVFASLNEALQALAFAVQDGGWRVSLISEAPGESVTLVLNTGVTASGIRRCGFRSIDWMPSAKTQPDVHGSQS